MKTGQKQQQLHCNKEVGSYKCQEDLAGLAGVQDFFFKNKHFKILCFCNHNYLTCYNPQEWTRPHGVPTDDNREMQVFGTFGRCWKEGVWECVCG